jgi:dUTP pyrophosphatase
MLIAFLHVVAEGDRIAQLILEKIHTPDIVEVNVGHLSVVGHAMRDAEFHDAQDLDETLRGSQGFGSTGGHAQLS